MRLSRVYRRRKTVLTAKQEKQTVLTAKQEKLQAQRDIYEMRADVLCMGAAIRLGKASNNLTDFDHLRDFINTDVAKAVDNASRAEKRYDESFRPSLRAGKSKSSAKHKPKTKK